MAIYNGRILMRKGNEADFDASKLLAGEWAVSLDAGIVRIGLEAGKIIRMATYEAFEKDMEQIEEILLSCQTIEQAVTTINTQVSANANACADYVVQAKTYRDEAESFKNEAKTFRNEAENFKNQAGEIVGIGIATTEKAGIVKPDGTSITVDADGTIHSVGGSGGTSNYNDLTNKPKINGVELVGDVSTDDLNINTGASDYVDLTNKPSINGIELSGNKTTEDLKIKEGTTDYTELLNKPSINGKELSGNVELDLGTNDYIELQNKPKINGVELSGDLSSSDLNLEPSGGVVDVVDNLLSTSTTLPLSANQGRVLDEKIGTINERLAFVDISDDYFATMPSYITNKSKIYRFGNIIFGNYRMNFNNNPLSNGATMPFTIKSKYCPKEDSVVFPTISNNVNGSGTLPITKDGSMVCWGDGLNSTINQIIAVLFYEIAE